jgi:hypothetical protein
MPKKKKKNQNVKLQLKPVMHIFCEGEKTEPNYIQGYMHHEHSGKLRLDIIRVEETDKNTPKQLVDIAADLKRESPSIDKFWVVYDREHEHKYPALIHRQARNKANANDIKIAFSNVCFEVWILLHFEQHLGSFDSYDDLWKRSRLRNNLPNYEKGCRNLYDRLKDRVSNARQNAKKMNAHTERHADSSWKHLDQWNPYTDFGDLLDAIDCFLTDDTQSGPARDTEPAQS